MRRERKLNEKKVTRTQIYSFNTFIPMALPPPAIMNNACVTSSGANPSDRKQSAKLALQMSVIVNDYLQFLTN